MSQAPCWKNLDWKKELTNNVRSVDQFKAYVAFDPDEEAALRQVAALHPINIPRYYLSLINFDDPRDPIRRMCFPSADELVVAGAMGATTTDPYGDDKHDKGNGVLHKYDCTALLITTERCAMHCRHCFRRRMVGHSPRETLRQFAGALDYIAAHKEINNVILSGGDPLTLDTPVLETMLEGLASLDHVAFARIGTRVPVTYPLRLFDQSLTDALRRFAARKGLYIATHYNHPREITPTSAAAIERIRLCGAVVNNQAVLLRGVNDSADTLAELMNGLLAIGVNPYYVYQCMPVARVRHHFQLPLKEGVALVDQARAMLSGYGKRFKYIIGHDIGKLEICGRDGDTLILKQLHARSGHAEQASRMLLLPLDDALGWVDFD